MAKHKWLVEWFRPIGEFKNGERGLLKMERFHVLRFRTENLARKRLGRAVNSPMVGFIRKVGWKRRRIIQLEVYDENYSGE